MCTEERKYILIWASGAFLMALSLPITLMVIIKDAMLRANMPVHDPHSISWLKPIWDALPDTRSWAVYSTSALVMLTLVGFVVGCALMSFAFRHLIALQQKTKESRFQKNMKRFRKFS
ncbi:hypothetical protein CSR02_07460 [Acetobacter pomorum]|uniref:Uncharacterized protein n=1 Tax=Acetobacter pomorum TaxID=65959 RepID=A0A2G4RD10_9PROT|nr:hypothetical protein AZ09_12350 [Acetobacter aceti 1023]PHY94463.1 hypothetical protein CSR02_07460 [Acetobacter pomorum]